MKTVRPQVETLKSRLGYIMEPGSWRKPGAASTDRGYGSKWRTAREAFLKAHPLCEMCKAEGKMVAANVVDHKIPHRGDMKLFWDSANNWAGLCRHHHSSTKQKAEAAF